MVGRIVDAICSDPDLPEHITVYPKPGSHPLLGALPAGLYANGDRWASVPRSVPSSPSQVRARRGLSATPVKVVVTDDLSHAAILP
jgi:hypothetical protein